MSALHLYGVVGADKLPTPSAEDAAGRVQLISEGSVAAIVGAAPACPLRELERDKALPFLLKRQRALEAAMAQTTVLPVRFGTVASDETAVRRMLIEGEALLKAKLDEFSGSQQFEVAVSWDLEKVFAQIAMESRISKSLKALNMETSDRERIEVGAMVKASLDRRRREYSERLFEELTTVAMDVAENALSDDGMVANFALLLDRADFASLEGVLNRLDADYAGKLDFRCIGPLPPSAFATVEVDFASAQAIGEAWRTAEASGGDRAVRLILSGDRGPDDLPDTDVIVNVVRRVPAVFGEPAPSWWGEGTSP